ncbi:MULTISPECIES: hypothetical protein [Thermodesulfobacterium]|uniref:Uncharacterized protein n=2 Tax=Thermodesulfobacterium commune TaxID=1741 RepID=A0A075X0T0_9BACT|nr:MULTISPECIES: hypothetical protein [Thermodesulfobacterium]KUJ97801.1 MAG: Uncharacterized protein XD42_0532 [Thermodesulfobacterium sp. 37_54]KUK19044.1 MAG: Uncharacterized protein XD55_0890 [Thermodesulfobacterium commune]AIH04582.1 hypothetical protein HL41_07810 [Thermodesulfobacterium commune DSM 2178]KUK37787.1 MAG: Uncharacterized protein XD67_0936 [Thermodesulfobacterium commune]MBZ4682109.1 hypothetical protein [Thermodesulfobacterium sp.]
MKKMVRLLMVFTVLCLMVNLKDLSAQEVIDVTKEVNVTGNNPDLVYYPVPFIPVLKDLSYQGEQSALLKTDKIITGMLVFKGNYKANSLLEFYRVQMKNNGWEEVGSFTSKITFVAYKRPEGHAFISVSEGYFSTELRIVIIFNKN